MTDDQKTLHKKTQALLRRADMTTMEIAQQSGLSFYWLRKFYAGAMENPSVNKVQSLYEFLTGKKLDV